MNQVVTVLTTPLTALPITLPITPASTSRLERPTVVADVPRLCLSPARRCSHDRPVRDLVSGDAVEHLRRLACRLLDMLCRG